MHNNGVMYFLREKYAITSECSCSTENSKSRKPNWNGSRDLYCNVFVYLKMSCAKLYRPYFQTVKL